MDKRIAISEPRFSSFFSNVMSSVYFPFVFIKLYTRQLCVQLIEWLKLNFASCVSRVVLDRDRITG